LGFIIGNLLVLLHFQKLLTNKAEIYLTFEMKHKLFCLQTQLRLCSKHFSSLL